jgi:phosphoserine phosphatase
MTDPVPLVVDLDGTLIDGDTLHLSLRLLARTRPWLVPTMPFMVLRGRAGFKEFVSRHVSLDPARLPYRGDVVEFVRRERATGRRVVLATAATRHVADAVAAHLGLFDLVVASQGGHNAKGDGKVESIRGVLGNSEFDYIGDSLPDVPVFKAARKSYLVCPSPALADAVRGRCHVEAVFVTARRTTDT